MSLFWLTIPELREKCRERGLPDSGTKRELIEHLGKLKPVINIAWLRKYFLAGFEAAQKCKKKGYKSTGRRFPSGERFEFEVSPEEAWQHCVEGKFRNALVCVWETPVYRVYENISRLKGEFAGDPEMQKKLQVVEGFFKNK